MRRWTLGWQIALAAYMQLISWVPLGRWNYQPCCPTGSEQIRAGTLSMGDAIGVLAFLLPLVFFVIGVIRGWRWAMLIAVAAYLVWFGLQIFTWWPPYLFGASPQWSRVYARAFSQATQILPRWGNHLPPDAMHLLLQVLLAGSIVTGWMMVRAAGRRFSPH